MEKSLRQLQEDQSELLNGIEHPRLGNSLGLAEEFGELMKEVVEIEMYGEKKQMELGEECADVLFSLFSLCDSYGINLDDVYSRKMEKIRDKIPEWRLKYGKNLAELRKKLD